MPLCDSISRQFCCKTNLLPSPLLLTMPKNKQLTKAQIEVIHALCGKIKSGLQNYNVSSLPKLKDAIQQLRDTMPQTYLQNVADSLPKRLKLDRNAKGYPIKY
ncbi:hypothetical protein Pcinc_031595 [Petrolisthes cinctipes]|uniref:Uncharacterized protein n=1 Tax=Petrolisthes cinctipes TaxID=88211 RepID=A0AAE1K2E1_PETCI|nr:hypothetical protein Pcinc_031595 [Petrolisthes cinctipes]